MKATYEFNEDHVDYFLSIIPDAIDYICFMKMDLMAKYKDNINELQYIAMMKEYDARLNFYKKLSNTLKIEK
jgi:hypothetical protein